MMINYGIMIYVVGRGATLRDTLRRRVIFYYTYLCFYYWLFLTYLCYLCCLFVMFYYVYVFMSLAPRPFPGHARTKRLAPRSPG